MSIGEGFLSTSLQVLFETLASPALSELGKLYGVKDEVVKLQKTLNRLRAMLQDAESKKMVGEQFPLRLRELKMVACEAEDVVDEFEYEDLRRKVKHAAEGRSGSCCKSLLSPTRKLGKFCYCLDPRTVSFRYKMARRIDGIRRKLDEISKDKKDLDIGETVVVGVSQPEFKGQMRETSSLLAEPEVFGRDKVKKELIDLLLATTDVGSTTSSSAAAAAATHPTCPSVLSIVGMGGLGKTTLARLVYNTEEVQEHFHLRIWVFVSLDFDLKRLTKQILEHVDVVDPQPNLQNTNNLNVLQRNLLERLKGKRFLLVLDDVWEEDYNKWKGFSAPLSVGGKGSKVLITTRNASVADMVRSVKIKLEDLSFEDCWMIFKKHAFPDANSDNHTALEFIGKSIVERLKGNPLAATTVGGLLRIESEERKWRHVLDSELWELKQGEEGIIPALRVSYEYLPPLLKQSFAYCAVFPKGHGFDMLELVQLWIAQGYVRPQGRKSVEDVGRDYFNELCNRSLIQFLDNDDKYVVHDLLHDLGQLILQHDFCQIRPNQVQEISEDAHFKLHLRLNYEESFGGELDVLCKFKSLRTLLFWPSDSIIYTQVPHNLFHRVKCLRVLGLSFSTLDTLPESIGCLKHLRYIDLRKTNIQSLPDSLCALLNLQTLRLGGCDKLSILPSDMSHLINLHYLEAKHELVSRIVKIGKLVRLHHLEVFSISEENVNRIGDLKNMKELRGKLCIQNLQRVKTREEASEAKFKNMKYLEELEMEWAGDRDADKVNTHFEESIIESLQPPPHLKGLIVKCYAGINFPSWMYHNSLSSLESVHLHKCINLKSFPPVGQMQFLKTLGVTGCPWLKELPSLPTTLESLILQDSGLHALPNSLHHLPLQQILIRKIPELRKLPLLPTTLKVLTVEDVGLEAIPEFSQCHRLSAPTLRAGNITDGGSSDNRKPVLSILEIHGCPHLTSLHEGLLNHHLRHLQVLSIKDCEELVSWPEGEGFRATLSSLDKELSIENCPKLNALPEGSKLHPSLKKLVVTDCPEVPNRSIFSQVHEFNSYGICIEKRYRSLAHCAEEALGQILALDSLKIKYLQEDDGLGVGTIDRQGSPPKSSPPPVFFMYDIEDLSVSDSGFMQRSMCRRVKLVIEVGRRGRGQQSADDDAINDDAVVDEDYEAKLLCTCLRGHPWTSSLRQLRLCGMPDAAFTGVVDKHMHHSYGGLGEGEAPLHHPLRLPSLVFLLLKNCRLPTKMLLPHLSSLKFIEISNSPRLTLSSLELGIRSVPSLESLWIFSCPKLMTPPVSNPSLKNNCDNDSEEEAALAAAAAAAAPAPPRPQQLPLLRTLSVDDLQLLTMLLGSNSHHGRPSTDSNNSGHSLCDHLLTSLRSLFIISSELTSFTAEAEEGLRTVASSLQQLALVSCPKLENLPADLKGLLPNLKDLGIHDCPGIRCLPDKGLPDSLEFLNISGCPELAKRCRPAGKHVWTLAHIPLVAVDDILLKGSCSKFLEVTSTWDFVRH